MKNLSERQKAFAAEYIKNGGNGYQAAIAAGYKENTAERQESTERAAAL